MSQQNIIGDPWLLNSNFDLAGIESDIAATMVDWASLPNHLTLDTAPPAFSTVSHTPRKSTLATSGSLAKCFDRDLLFAAMRGSRLRQVVQQIAGPSPSVGEPLRV
jgi:hypothetical protein